MTKKAGNPKKAGDSQKGKVSKTITSEVLPPKAAEILKNELGPEAFEQAQQVLIASQMSGPLPVSSEFAAYDAVLPGAAREILEMAKKEQSNRHLNSNKDLNGGIAHQFLALILGAGLLAGCIIGAIYLAVNNESGIAALLLGVAVLGVITSIIKSRPVFTGRVSDNVDHESSQAD